MSHKLTQTDWLLIAAFALLYLLCVTATLFYPRSATGRSGSFRARASAVWNDVTEERDRAIVFHCFLAVALAVGIAIRLDNPTLGMELMGFSLLLIHIPLLRIPNGLTGHAWEWILYCLDLFICMGGMYISYLVH